MCGQKKGRILGILGEIHSSKGFVRSCTYTSPSLPGNEVKGGHCLGSHGKQQKTSWIDLKEGDEGAVTGKSSNTFDCRTQEGASRMDTIILLSLFFPNSCCGSPLAKLNWNPE